MAPRKDWLKSRSVPGGRTTPGVSPPPVWQEPHNRFDVGTVASPVCAGTPGAPSVTCADLRAKPAWRPLLCFAAIIIIVVHCLSNCPGFLLILILDRYNPGLATVGFSAFQLSGGFYKVYKGQPRVIMDQLSDKFAPENKNLPQKGDYLPSISEHFPRNNFDEKYVDLRAFH